MKVILGCLYFVSDDFFEKANDPYLKQNYETTKRPHYFAIKDNQTNLFWLVPCSSKIEKFEDILTKKAKQGKPTDTIKIVQIQNKKIVLLFQDMFPISEKYIAQQYIRGKQPVYIADPKIVNELQKTATKVIKLIRRGVKFTPTQPDALFIEKMIMKELSLEHERKVESPNIISTNSSLQEKLARAQLKAVEKNTANKSVESISKKNKDLEI